MTDNPGLLLTILAFVLVIGPLVFVHELGHYIAARVFGVHAETFAIGFGRSIGGFTDRRGTRWQFGWLPLGGYVRFAGDMSPASTPSDEWLALPPEERARTFQAKPVWQRAIIVAAGPAINFLVALVILAAFAMAYGESRTLPVAERIVAGSPAAAAGVQTGDRITAVAGREVNTFKDMAAIVQYRPNELLAFDIVRDGQPIRLRIKTATVIERDRFGNEFRLGRLGIESPTPVVVQAGPLEAPVIAVRQTGQILTLMVDALGQVITGRRPVEELGGPLKIAKFSGEQIVSGPEAFIMFVALISINLGFINLLPVPMLDGGHLLFYAIEAVRRRPVGLAAQEWAYRSGLLVLLGLMVFVTVNDLASFGVWERLSGLIG